MTERQDMEAVIEAVLFVANEPVTADKLLEVFDEREREAGAEALEAVLQRYGSQPERGIQIDEVAGGLRLVTRPDLHGYLRRFFEVSGSNKLSMPALETLAIIAYRQPVTGPEIQELRGVNSAGVVKTLLERHLIRIAGRKEVVGKPFLYSTTRDFLVHFGLRSLKELPPLERFEEIYGGDSEAAPESMEPDHEEQVLIEAAALEEKEAAEAAAAEEAEEAQAAAEAEAAEETEEAAAAAETEAAEETEEAAAAAETEAAEETEEAAAAAETEAAEETEEAEAAAETEAAEAAVETEEAEAEAPMVAVGPGEPER